MFVRSVLAALAIALSCVLSSAQPSGTVSIVDRFGNHLPGNSFTRIDAVYFTGGKGPNCSAPGLADGDYYFQVTDPAGTVLLTPEPLAQRLVHASGGNLTAYLGRTRPSGFLGPCGALHVRLAPFLTTPYPIGEYKLWLTRVQDYSPTNTTMFGFDPGLSKSDNFRVAAQGAQAIVRGHKFYDHDRGGTWNPLVDPLEVPVGGWRVELRKNGVLDGVTFTDQDGWYQFIRDRDGSTYELREISPNGFVNDATAGATWLATTARTGLAVTSSEYVAGPEFGNVHFELTPGVGRTVGFWSTDCDDEDDEHDDDSNGNGNGNGNGDNDDDSDDCSNGGTNPVTGRALLQGADPLWRQVLTTFDGLPVKLRKPISNDLPQVSIYVPPPLPEEFEDAFESWVRYANRNPHDHAGYLLSIQVAAAMLSNRVGFMQGDIYIDRFNDGVLVSFHDMLTGAIGLLRQTGAGLTGPNDPFQDLRHMMQMCTNEFGRINETGDVTAAQVVYRSSDLPPRVVSPY